MGGLSLGQGERDQTGSQTGTEGDSRTGPRVDRSDDEEETDENTLVTAPSRLLSSSLLQRRPEGASFIKCCPSLERAVLRSNDTVSQPSPQCGAEHLLSSALGIN